MAKTEEAKAGGSAPDMPTSVWSLIARPFVDHGEEGKANDGGPNH